MFSRAGCRARAVYSNQSSSDNNEYFQMKDLIGEYDLGRRQRWLNPSSEESLTLPAISGFMVVQLEMVKHEAFNGAKSGMR